MLVSRVFGLPLSFRSPARHTRSRAASVSTTMSAISSVTSWWPAMGLPNVLRVGAYVTEASMQACATPAAPAATECRPESSALIAILKPCPTSPRRFASGTRTSSRMSSLESEDRNPSFPWSAWLPYGCRSRSRTNAVMPLSSFDGSACANTSARPDTEPFEIHVLRPRSTHESPSRLALVRIFVASLPTSGSVRPKHPMTSPLQRRGSQRCFCSSVPNFRMVISTREICTESGARAEVTYCAPILGGLDAATYALDLEVAGERRELVLRIYTMEQQRDGEAARRHWAAITGIPASAPIPVPRGVLLDAEGALLGFPT